MRLAVTLALVVLSSSARAAEDPWPPFEAQVLSELNRLRQRPAEWAAELRRYRQTFRGRISYERGRRNGAITQEGVAAVDEAIAFLDKQTPLPPLGYGPVLSRTARILAIEQERSGRTGHVSADGRAPGDRARAAGGGIYVGETISYGFFDPRGAVRLLVVDDGVPGRGHRRLVFSTRYRYAGAGCGPHPGFNLMCVINYAETPDGEAPAAPPRARAKAK